MNATTKRYQDLTFDELIRSAQEGDGGAIAYILLEAKYIDYTFFNIFYQYLENCN